MPRTLDELRPGEEAIVIKVTGSGEVRRRILDMGVGKGATVKVEKVAPLGDPIDINVRGYHLSIRKGDAGNILIREVDRG